MTVIDYNAILGKRVKLTLLGGEVCEDIEVTGRCIGFPVLLPQYSYAHDLDRKILFLEDGWDEADFIYFDHLELI